MREGGGGGAPEEKEEQGKGGGPGRGGEKGRAEKRKGREAKNRERKKDVSYKTLVKDLPDMSKVKARRKLDDIKEQQNEETLELLD